MLHYWNSAVLQKMIIGISPPKIRQLGATEDQKLRLLIFKKVHFLFWYQPWVSAMADHGNNSLRVCTCYLHGLFDNVWPQLTRYNLQCSPPERIDSFLVCLYARALWLHNIIFVAWCAFHIIQILGLLHQMNIPLDLIYLNIPIKSISTMSVGNLGLSWYQLSRNALISLLVLYSSH